MVSLTDEMMKEIENMGIYAIATASKGGVPNVVPIGMVIPKGNDKFWVIDNYMDKTIKNVKENPVVAFYVWNKDGKIAFQVKCDAKVENTGADYEEAKAFAKKKRETLPAKNLIKLKIREVYSVSPGPDAGKKLL
ncbi:MAG: pyridoxamine 5-phosphate oxidase [Thermoplasmatales archaeon]|nr:pyridoxamine 5-phosphate oxidase [Thermoplasmatales archaeon]